MSPAVIRFSTDNWSTSQELSTQDTGTGVHIADLPTAKMNCGDVLCFTFCWPQAADRWEGRNFDLEVIEQPSNLGKTSVYRTSPSHPKSMRSNA
jgi:glucoamylase